MNSTRFDGLARRAGAIDRKTSLKLLGGSLAAVAAQRPLTGEAKQLKCGKKVRKTCAR